MAKIDEKKQIADLKELAKSILITELECRKLLGKRVEPLAYEFNNKKSVRRRITRPGATRVIRLTSRRATEAFYKFTKLEQPKKGLHLVKVDVNPDKVTAEEIDRASYLLSYKLGITPNYGLYNVIYQNLKKSINCTRETLYVCNSEEEAIEFFKRDYLPNENVIVLSARLHSIIT